MTTRHQASTAWWRCCAGAALLLWAGQALAATVSTPMEGSAQLPADAYGAGKTLDKALTGADSSTLDRKPDMALEMQRADLAARNRPGADAATVARSAAPPQPSPPTTPALALPPPGAGNGMPAALSLGGLFGSESGLATARSSRREADQRWNNAQGNTDGGPGGGPVGSPGGGAHRPTELAGVRRLAAALRDFLLVWRAWLLGGVALVVLVAWLAQLVRKGARHRTGQSAIEQAAQRAGRRSGGSTGRRRSSNRSVNPRG